MNSKFASFWFLILFLAFLIPSSPLSAAVEVGLFPSVESPAPLGTLVNWLAFVPGAETQNLWYRFRIREATPAYRSVRLRAAAPAAGFQVVRDYGPEREFAWATIDHEGDYEVEVSVRDLDSGETSTTSAIFHYDSRVLSGVPAVSVTAHPLVFFYSAPPCPPGSRMSVSFARGGGPVQMTPSRDCLQGFSMNFYLAGMTAETEYTASHVIESASGPRSGQPVAFVTGAIPSGFPQATVTQTPDGATPFGFLLQSMLFSRPVATDRDGNVVWFDNTDSTLLTRPETGGTMFAIRSTPNRLDAEIFREFDLAGVTIRETNVARVNEQLAALGNRPTTSFHHEARKLPGGRSLVLGSVEELLTDVQGPGAANVVTDMIIILDSDLRVVWVWDGFDHLDAAKAAVLGETCTDTGGCPRHFLAELANDWTHGNAVQYTPDGNLLFSARHLDWLIKIDYQDGAGGGDIIWRLGKDGDFQFLSDDPFPWFSHQHDGEFDNGDNSRLTVFDNGNTRFASDDSATSRGQVLELDEVNRTATLLVNANLGIYAPAVGSAQRLSSGNFLFGAGWVLDESSPSGFSTDAFEVSPAGDSVYIQRVPTQSYRTFLLRDMCSPD